VADPKAAPAGVAVTGHSILLERGIRIGSLRYFDAGGPLGASLREAIGGPLPEPLRAVRYRLARSGEEIILAWRSPTETLLMTRDDAAFAAILSLATLHGAAGCLVEQTGGLWAWHVSGARTRDLLERLGSSASVPALGEARTSRMAELPVLALRVREEQVILLVERVYSDHLLGWMSETALDFEGGGASVR
jgi:sarcosine oxidase gamma subunit